MSTYSQNFTSVGLNTLSFSVPVAGIYTLKGQLTVPTLTDGGGASSVVVTVHQNSTLLYTGAAGATGFAVYGMSCAAGDTITVTTASSASPDAPLNAVRADIQIG